MTEILELYAAYGAAGLLAGVVYKFVYLRMKDEIIQHIKEKEELMGIVKDMLEKQHESMRWIKDGV